MTNTAKEIDNRVDAARTEYRYNRIIEMLGKCEQDQTGKGARIINLIFEILQKFIY